MWGELHEEKTVSLLLSRTWSAGEGNVALRSLGFTLHYDVYSLEASRSEPWQAESVAAVTLFRDGEEVDAQDDFDRIDLSFLLASRPSTDVDAFLETVESVAGAFVGTLVSGGRPTTLTDLRTEYVACVDFLLKEWGEEPGSESLARMIHENRRRPT